MPFKNILIPLLALGAILVAFFQFRWPGVALVVGGLVMWVLLQFTRTLQVLKRAADLPVGHVASAVMLHSKLRPGLPLLHVVALTRALGKLESPAQVQPEQFRWTDTSGSSVLCVFQDGKLQRWDLTRPAVEGDQ